ncbi:hypothetical protein DIS24_g1982 [Lasiodiplodia hormozganensis]|uniref:Uncharacterized protein n=1 Tax=Lasiodiplodia hormozganensis TaxID=869390 RepID=A0AA40D3Z0_9PEZI|nr:hypothetical protein DIS24_g1982 [Lasiodiplodia hormozganensis]
MDGGIVTNAAIEGYIRWDLEREHGDLGLESSCDLKPPASSLCKALARHKNSNAAQELVTYIAEKADRDITQARLRLDLVREAETANETQHTIERLPKSVIAVFNAGIKSVREQEEPSRTLGLNAICLVTDGDVSEGIETGIFLERLQALCSPNWDRTAKSDLLDEIIYASRGLLSVWLVEGEKEKVVAYHHDFFFYVQEDYDELLSAVRRNIKLN